MTPWFRTPHGVIATAVATGALTLGIALSIGDASQGGRAGGSEVMLAGGVLALVLWAVGAGWFITSYITRERPQAGRTGRVVAGGAMILVAVAVAVVWCVIALGLALVLSEGCCA